MLRVSSLSQLKYLSVSMQLRIRNHLTSNSTIGPPSASSTTWPKLPVLISCTQLTRLQSTHQTRKRFTEKPFCIWYTIWRRLVTLDSSSSLIQERGSNASVMLISLDFGTRCSHWSILALPSHKAAGSSSMPVAESLGPQNFNLKLHSLLLRPNTLLCPRHYVMSFQSWVYCRKWGSANFKSLAPNPTCIARYLKTTPGLLNWLGCPNYILAPSTSTYATITFVSMFGRDSSRSFPTTRKNKSPIPLQSLWHKNEF